MRDLVGLDFVLMNERPRCELVIGKSRNRTYVGACMFEIHTIAFDMSFGFLLHIRE